MLICLIAVCTAGGCGRKNEPESIPIKPDGEDHPVLAVENPENEDGSGEKTLVYLILPSDDGSAAREMNVIRQAAKEAGAEMKVLNYMGDPIAEANALEQASREGADLIICDNIDETQTLRGIRSAKKKGIPVLLIGKGIDMLGMASYQVLAESYSCIRKLGEEYASRRKKGAAYVILEGEDTLGDLTDAFSSVMLGRTGIKELGRASCSETDAMEAYNTAWDLLSEHKNADTIVCANTLQTQAALDAAGDLGLAPSVICLYGDTDLIVQYVEEGKVYAAIVKPAESIAEEAAEQMKAYLESGELPLTETYYVEGEILTAPEP